MAHHSYAALEAELRGLAGELAEFGPTHQAAVTPIQTATNTALPQITVGGDSCVIVITPDGKTAYVTNMSSGTVTSIRTATNTAMRPIKVGCGSCAIAITP